MRRMLLVCLAALCVWGVFRQVKATLFAGPYPRPVSKDLYASDYRGSKAPDLVVPAWVTHEPDTKGKVVLVDFWATWCGPCRAAIPELNQLQAAFKDDLVVIGISDETPDTIRNFRAQNPMNYFVGTDPTGVTKFKMGVEGIPNVMIISTDGVVRWQGIPMDPMDPLTAKTVKDIIDVDPGIAKRHAEEKNAVPAQKVAVAQ